MHPKAPRKGSAHSESGGRTSAAAPTKTIAHSCGGLLAPQPSGTYFLARLCPQLIEMHPEAPRKASTHSESGGQTSHTPPTKAIAHTSWGLFPLGSFRTPTFGYLVLGAAAPVTTHGHTEAPRKASAHLESSGRTSHSPPTKDIANLSWGPWVLLAPRPLGVYSWVGLYRRLLEMHQRPLAKPRPIPSPIDELRPRPPPRL